MTFRIATVIGVTTVLIITVFFLLKFADFLTLRLEKLSENVGKRIGLRFKWGYSLLVVEILAVVVISLLLYSLFLSLSMPLRVLILILFLIYAFFSGSLIQFLEVNNPSPFSLKKSILGWTQKYYILNRVAIFLDETNSFVLWVMIPLSLAGLISLSLIGFITLQLYNIFNDYLYVLFIALLLCFWTYLPSFKREEELSKNQKISAKKVLLYALATSWFSIEAFIKLSSSSKNNSDKNQIILSVLVGLFLTLDRLLKAILDDYKLFYDSRVSSNIQTISSSHESQTLNR